MRDDDLHDILSPITLPCGRTLQNRLVKAALYEHGATLLGGPPSSLHFPLYALWGAGHWGMVITGNIQVSRSHLTLGADIVIPSAITPATLAPFRRLASAMHGTAPASPLAIMQLNHTGRQATNFIGGRLPVLFPPLAPSATRVGRGSDEGICARALYSLLFSTAREMSLSDIDDVVDGFARGAMVALESGFDGVQLHASHGYLLSQFISRKTNFRTDEYGEPLFLLRRITKRIRSCTPPTFVLGVKLNASNYVSGGFTEEHARAHVREIAAWGMDFIEISGGDYEQPDFLAKPSSRQAFFTEFTHTARAALAAGPARPLVLLTGGLRTRAQLAGALRRRHADLLGLGRLAVLHPALPLRLAVRDASFLAADAGDPSPAAPEWFPRVAGAGVRTAWYVVAMRRAAAGKGPPYGVGAVGVVLEMYLGGAYGWLVWTTILLGLLSLVTRLFNMIFDVRLYSE